MAPCDVAANEWAWSLRYIPLSSPPPPPPPPSTLSWSKRVSSWRWLSKIPRSSSPITCTGECHIYIRWLRGSTCSFASSSPAINCHSSYHRSSRLGYQPPTHTHTLTLSTVDAFSAWLLGMTPPSTASWSTQSSSTAHTASRSTGESGAEGSTWGEG